MGDDIAQKAIQASLFAWMPRFRAAVGDATTDRPAKDLAAYIALFHEVAGIDSTILEGERGYSLLLNRALQSFVGGDVSQLDQTRFSQLLGRAWNAVGIRMGCNVICDEDGKHWLIQS